MQFLSLHLMAYTELQIHNKHRTSGNPKFIPSLLFIFVRCKRTKSSWNSSKRPPSNLPMPDGRYQRIIYTRGFYILTFAFGLYERSDADKPILDSKGGPKVANRFSEEPQPWQKNTRFFSQFRRSPALLLIPFGRKTRNARIKTNKADKYSLRNPRWLHASRDE